MTPLISSYPSWHYTFSTMKQHFFSVDTALFYLITRILLIISSFNRAVATNSGPGGGGGGGSGSNLDLFYIVSANVV